LSKPRFLARLTDENAPIDVPNPDGFLVRRPAGDMGLLPARRPRWRGVAAVVSGPPLKLAMQRPLSWSLRRWPSIGVGRALTTSGSSIEVLADGCALDEMGWSVPVASEPQRRSTWSDP
jgi:hypothetical protein